jgi:hypothetical protein
MEKHKLPKGALRLVAQDCHAYLQFEEKDGKRIPKLDMTVYSGGVINDHWYWGKNFAIDLEGIKFDRKKYPILENHMTSRKIGFSGKPIIEGSVKINPDTTTFVSTDASEEFLKLAEEGFPYQASIYAIPSVVEWLEDGVSVEVNGFKMKGPGAVWRQCLYQEASICVFGWDKKTEAAIFSKEETELPIQFIGGDKETEDEEKNTNTQTGEEVNTLEITLQLLTEKAPELLAQIQKDAVAAIKVQTEGEMTQLQTQLASVTENMNKMSEELLKLGKSDIIRQENDRRDTAEKIWDKKLSQSDLEEDLFDKVRVHVNYTKFVKDGILDTEAFTKAVEDEILDWEKKMSGTGKVLGGGTTFRDVTTVPSDSDKKLVDDTTNTLLTLAGQPPRVKTD